MGASIAKAARGLPAGHPKGVASSKRRPKGAEMPKKATEAAATTGKPAARTTSTGRTKKAETTAPNREHVATRAYYIHLAEGGDATENWLRAERELLVA
jgi:hypothetical protein